MKKHIDLTSSAKNQLQILLTQEDEWKTILGERSPQTFLHLRVSIDGKNCDGFTYSIGFDHPKPDDELIIIAMTKPFEVDHVNYPSREIFLCLDPLCQEYLKNMTIDYQLNTEMNQDGFTILNHQQKEYKGKFWKKKKVTEQI